MHFSLWLALVGAGTLISFTPGAGAIFTMSNSLNSGFRRSIWGILGQQVALVIHIVIVALGVGVLVSNSPLIFNIIRYAGAAYLVYLGIRQFLHKPDLDKESVEEKKNEPALSMFQRGIWVNLLNPKAIVFFLAFMPQFIRPSEPLLQQYVVLTATVIVIDIMVMWFFFALAARSFQRFTHNAHGQKILNRVFGCLFVLVGVLLAVIH
ncbi:LysE family transporter [Arthrobacter sp. TES]|uniref:LysE family transporter n=1 Tax=Paenarthrobacter TaxID=1742992 RepID=UPI0003975675|nr:MULTISPECIES: LysE family transporter [Paenarthrobacter]AMB41779.1 lysine transporter LysE [Arthrobacter sp. ATCC 21022]ERI35996.1 lysine transporter LysE [Arthrobacter sp. AK-YN10]QOI62020.1 LysE family transporter [Arthrobacter sp. TES]BCW85782.1 threonine transporter RhtB [Arthrobacter sp. NicSoilE8]KUR63015.1 lysine transporter LysE [Arthrobacter sp. ATCC 21022]